MKRSLCIGLIAGFVLLLAGSAYALQEAQNMNVTANAQGDVSIVAITDIDFGSFSASVPPGLVGAAGSIQISDPFGFGYEIAIGEGNNLNMAVFGARALSDGAGGFMPYWLNQPFGGPEWGTNFAFIDPVPNTYPNGDVLVGGGDFTYPVDATLDTTFVGLPGTYSDTVVVTLMY